MEVPSGFVGYFNARDAIAANGGVQVKFGPGVVYGFDVTAAGSSDWQVEAFDGTDAGGVSLGTASLAALGDVLLHRTFTRGLYLVTSGTTPGSFAPRYV